MARPPGRRTLPAQLSTKTSFHLDPQIFRDLRIRSLAEEFGSASEWLHDLLCRELDREDLRIENTQHAKSH